MRVDALERDELLEPRCALELAEVHRGHPAGAEFAVDDVAIREGDCETGEGVGHRRGLQAAPCSKLEMHLFITGALTSGPTAGGHNGLDSQSKAMLPD